LAVEDIDAEGIPGGPGVPGVRGIPGGPGKEGVVCIHMVIGYTLGDAGTIIDELEETYAGNAVDWELEDAAGTVPVSCTTAAEALVLEDCLFCGDSAATGN